MSRVSTFLLVIWLSVIIGSPLFAQLAPAPKIQGQPTIQPFPTPIIRNPPALRLQQRPLTNRVVPKAGLADLLRRGIPGNFAGKAGQAPGKTALIVILENGGIMNNVDPELRKALNVNIRTAQCKFFLQEEFELKAGESLLDLIGRLGGWLVQHAQCADPRNWETKTLNPLQVLNQMTDTALENAVKAHNSLLNTQSRYDQVVVLEDSDAVPSNVIAMIRQLAPAYALDIHVLTHGGNEFFTGFNKTNFTNANFFNQLLPDKDAGRLFIRAVYQMNCVSGTLKDNWRAVGAVAVNGTEALHNNNMPHQYFHFLNRWLNGQEGMRSASYNSWAEAASYTRPIYNIVGRGGQLVDISQLTATGSNVNATVNSAR